MQGDSIVKRHFFVGKIADDKIPRLTEIILKYGGSISANFDDATHILEWDDDIDALPSTLVDRYVLIKSQKYPEQLNTGDGKEIVKEEKLPIHWIFRPDSHDEIIDSADIDGTENPILIPLIRANQNQRIVCCRYIYDCEIYKEWGNENDYEIKFNILQTYRKYMKQTVLMDCEQSDQSTNVTVEMNVEDVITDNLKIEKDEKDKEDKDNKENSMDVEVTDTAANSVETVINESKSDVQMIAETVTDTVLKAVGTSVETEVIGSGVDESKLIGIESVEAKIKIETSEKIEIKEEIETIDTKAIGLNTAVQTATEIIVSSTTAVENTNTATDPNLTSTSTSTATATSSSTLTSVGVKRKVDNTDENINNSTTNVVAVKQKKNSRKSSQSLLKLPLWFNYETVNYLEIKNLPEFFTSNNGSNKTKEYIEIRNFIVNLSLQNPYTYLSATDCRKKVAGDVCVILRIQSFLDNFGAINFNVKPDCRPTLNQNSTSFSTSNPMIASTSASTATSSVPSDTISTTPSSSSSSLPSLPSSLPLSAPIEDKELILSKTTPGDIIEDQSTELPTGVIGNYY